MIVVYLAENGKLRHKDFRVYSVDSIINGGGGKATKIFCRFGLRPGVTVMWSKIFDHGRNFKITI